MRLKKNLQLFNIIVMLSVFKVFKNVEVAQWKHFVHIIKSSSRYMYKGIIPVEPMAAETLATCLARSSLAVVLNKSDKRSTVFMENSWNTRVFLVTRKIENAIMS